MLRDELGSMVGFCRGEVRRSGPRVLPNASCESGQIDLGQSDIHGRGSFGFRLSDSQTSVSTVQQQRDIRDRTLVCHRNTDEHRKTDRNLEVQISKPTLVRGADARVAEE